MTEENKALLTAKIWSSDPLYTTVSSYLAYRVGKKIVVGSRNDYRDPSCFKITLDYGEWDCDFEDHKLKFKVQHTAPTETTDAYLMITSDKYETNMAVISYALRTVIKDVEKRVVQVYSWENAWQQRQAVWVTDHEPSKTQIRAVEEIEWFYKNAQFYMDNKSRYQRGVILSGATCSGKHWLVRYCAFQHNKAMCYLPVTEVTYSSIGPAMACAPLNSILVIDNLVQFYNHIPSSERPVFLRHLGSVFNTAVHDPRGFLIVVLAPVAIPSELEKFLLLPHRCQKRFELSLSGKDDVAELLQERVKGVEEETLNKVAAKLQSAHVPFNVLDAFFTNATKEKILGEDLVAPLELLAQQLKDERSIIDQAASGNRERLYS